MAISSDPNDPNFGLETDQSSPDFGLPEKPAPEPTIPRSGAQMDSLAAREIAPQLQAGVEAAAATVPEAIHTAGKVQEAVINPAGFVSEALTPKPVADFMRQELVSPEAVDTVRQAAQYPVPTLTNLLFGTDFKEQGALAGAGQFASRQIAAQTTPENIALIAGTEGLGALEKGLAKTAPGLAETLFGRAGKEAEAATAATETAVKPPPENATEQLNRILESKGKISEDDIKSSPVSQGGEQLPSVGVPKESGVGQGTEAQPAQGQIIWRANDKTNTSKASDLETGKFYAPTSQNARAYSGGGRELISEELSGDAKGFKTASNKHVLAEQLGLTPKDSKLAGQQYHDLVDKKLAEHFRKEGYDYYSINNGSEIVVLNDKAILAQPAQEVAPAVPAEKVQPGEFGQKGYTAVDTADQPALSRIANRHTEERAAAGELGQIAPGQGYSKMDLVKQGEKMAPEEVNQHVSDLMQKTGDPIKQASAVSVEEARLSKRSSDLSRAAQADPTNVDAKLAADNAFKDLTDFHVGPVARLKEVFHGTGEGLQGEVPVDLTTVNGFREAYFKDTGKLPTASMDKNFESTAARVSKSIEEDNGARTTLSTEIEKQSASRKLPSYDEVRNNIRERMGLEPCAT